MAERPDWQKSFFCSSFNFGAKNCFSSKIFFTNAYAIKPPSCTILTFFSQFLTSGSNLGAWPQLLDLRDPIYRNMSGSTTATETENRTQNTDSKYTPQEFGYTTTGNFQQCNNFRIKQDKKTWKINLQIA